MPGELCFIISDMHLRNKTLLSYFLFSASADLYKTRSTVFRPTHQSIHQYTIMEYVEYFYCYHLFPKPLSSMCTKKLACQGVALSRRDQSVSNYNSIKIDINIKFQGMGYIIKSSAKFQSSRHPMTAIQPGFMQFTINLWTLRIFG